MKRDWNIRTIYLYLVSFTTLLMIIFGTINVVRSGIGLAFPEPAMPYMEKFPPGEVPSENTEEREARAQLEAERFVVAERNRQMRNLFESLAAVLVASPVYLYHWRQIRRDEETPRQQGEAG